MSTQSRLIVLHNIDGDVEQKNLMLPTPPPRYLIHETKKWETRKDSPLETGTLHYYEVRAFPIDVEERMGTFKRKKKKATT